MEKNIPKISIFINVDNVDEGVKKILREIRPNWIEIEDQIKFKIFSDGITNKLFGYYLKDIPESIIIFKIYGVKTELMIDRAMEIDTLKLLHKEKLGPELYAVFENGIVYEFIAGKTLDTESCQNPIIFNLVANEMGKFHSIVLDGENSDSKKPMFWELLQKLNILTDGALTTNENLISKFKKVGITSGWGTKALEELKNIIENEKMPLGFCHNDLLLANVIYNEEINKVSFIDFEYSGINYTPFDIANHFCEFAGGIDTDFSKCPDDIFKTKWISVYLKNLFEGNHSFDLKIFLRWVNICIPLSHLYWILFGIAQANNSKIDFDFIKYAMIRIPEYESCMKNIQSYLKTS